MKQELIDIIARLKRDEKQLLTIIDAETYRPIINSWSSSRFCEKYGSVEAFFNDLAANGTKEIVVEERQKHGNSTRAFGERKRFTLIDKTQTAHVETAPEVAPQVAVPAPIVPQTQIPLNGLAGFGLGLPQLMDLHVSAHDKTRLETENKFYKEENERLKKEVAELKEERLENKFSEAKAKSNNEMLMGFLQIAPSLLGAYKGGATPTGLAAPQPEALEIPKSKQILFEKFSSTSREVDNYLLAVLEGVYHNQSFFNELDQLLKKYQLISEEK